MLSSVDELIIVANIVTESLQSVAKVKRTVMGPMRPIVAWISQRQALLR